MKCDSLDVWKRSVQLSVEVYKYFSVCKDFGFKDQITRSCLAIPSNLAEGLEKQYLKDQIRYIDISKGSAAEFATQTIIGTKIGYIDNSTSESWLKEINEILSMMSKLQSYKKHKINSPRP